MNYILHPCSIEVNWSTLHCQIEGGGRNKRPRWWIFKIFANGGPRINGWQWVIFIFQRNAKYFRRIKWMKKQFHSKRISCVIHWFINNYFYLFLWLQLYSLVNSAFMRYPLKNSKKIRKRGVASLGEKSQQFAIVPPPLLFDNGEYAGVDKRRTRPRDIHQKGRLRRCWNRTQPLHEKRTSTRRVHLYMVDG